MSDAAPGLALPDVLEHVFSFLPLPDLRSAAAVCKQWHSVLSSGVRVAFSSFFSYGSHRISYRCAVAGLLEGLFLPPLESLRGSP